MHTEDTQYDADRTEQPLTYERPLITDQGSLTELTLGGGSDFTDGSGIGGSGS